MPDLQDTKVQTARHTPGPWEALMDRRNKAGQELNPVVLTRCDGYQHGNPVATMSASNKAAVFANARLIAAAPDLLAALHGLRAVIDRVSNAGFPDLQVHPLVLAADAAIAQAEGR